VAGVSEPEELAALRGPDAARAAQAAAALWRRWHQPPDAATGTLLRDGIAAMERQDFREADALFSRLIRMAPDFAEGWNKRATLRFVVKDYEGSIADCGETLARNPNHFGALSGQGLCHMALGQHREAADLFRRTLAVHPHLESARENLRAALSEVVKWN
jgi:tetratricopeptide (TPR) repeat protein